ncbi:unnamed protein product [Amoebophrya sp. A120]|nr:unnamed protein product [Amoebophrya sp. A120]|eukprot:GSA120T00010318001.1
MPIPTVISGESLASALENLVPNLDEDTRAYAVDMVCEEQPETGEALAELLGPFLEEHTTDEDVDELCKRIFQKVASTPTSASAARVTGDVSATTDISNLAAANAKSTAENFSKSDAEPASPENKPISFASRGAEMKNLADLMKVSDLGLSDDPFSANPGGDRKAYTVQEVDNSAVARRQAKRRQKATGLKLTGSGLTNSDAKMFYQNRFSKRMLDLFQEGIKVSRAGG